MSQTFQFELVSPEKLIASKPAVMVTVPGGEGMYGVMSGHAPMITTVHTGVIEVYERDDKHVTDRIFVAGGFAEVNGDSCTILAEEAARISEINRAAVVTQIQDLLAKIEAETQDDLRDELSAKLAIAQAKLEILPA